METTRSTNRPVSNTPNLRICQRCRRIYDWRGSASVSLKMTYCTGLCESADLGITVDQLLRSLEQRGRKAA